MNRLYYIYSNDTITASLIFSAAKNISNLDPMFCKHGKLGLLGISKEQATKYGYSHLDMAEPKKNLEVGSTILNVGMEKIRMFSPSIPIKHWYMFSISYLIRETIEDLNLSDFYINKEKIEQFNTIYKIYNEANL